MADRDVPPGWSYNPASWPQRLPIAAFAAVGFVIAMYLALFQWRVFPTVWEPLFGDSTRKLLLESDVSRLTEKYLFVPDAFLGALGYLADAVAALIGGPRRWRTMPWVVVLFGLFVGPLGVISVLLVILQPILAGWCTLCVVTAAISVVMIGPAMDEVLASLQHLKRERLAGRSVWRAFWGLGEKSAAGQAVGAGR
jgi:hypothetical protein